MTVICPTVTATNEHIYRTQLENVSDFTARVHLDLADGKFANRLIVPSKIWWPGEITADIHLMYKDPMSVIDDCIALKPNLLIVHAEASGDFLSLAKLLRENGIKRGVALLQRTSVDTILASLEEIDYVLIFSGDLGYFGGKADLKLLEKVSKLKEFKPDLEVGWDGGINDENAKALVDGGVDVLNVGGFIQRSKDPKKAYTKLQEVVGNA